MVVILLTREFTLRLVQSFFGAFSFA